MSGHPPMWLDPDYDQDLITAAEPSSIEFIRDFRGAGWRGDCPKCVASKFTCDEHFVADISPSEWSVIEGGVK